MKSFCITLLLLCFVVWQGQTQSPQWFWAKSGEPALGYAGVTAGGVCADNQRNVYAGGYYLGPSASFGNFTLANSDTSGLTFDIFIAKYDSVGNEVWIHSARGVRTEMLTGIAVDDSDNVFIAGNFESPVLIIGGITLLNRGSYDGFIAKFSPAGNLLWAKSCGGISYENVRGIATDAFGNAYLTGGFQSAFMVAGNDTLFNFDTTSHSEEGFLIKYDAVGHIEHAFKSNATFWSYGTALDGDNKGNLFATGYLEVGQINLGGHILSATNGNLYAAKYDSAGHVIWATNTGTNSYGYALSKSIAADNYGNVFIAGNYYGKYITFNGITYMNSDTSGNSNDFFVLKYDSLGNLLWVKTGVGLGTDVANSISTDADGDVYLSGGFNSMTVDFSNVTLSRVGLFKAPMYVLKFNTDGFVLCYKLIHATGYDPNAISADKHGNAFTVGDFNVTQLSLGTTSLYNSSGAPYFFISKFTCDNIDDVPSITHSNPKFQIYPNPASSAVNIVIDETLIGSTVTVTDIAGREIMKSAVQIQNSKFEIPNLRNGIYIVSIRKDGAVLTQKLVVQR